MLVRKMCISALAISTATMTVEAQTPAAEGNGQVDLTLQAVAPPQTLHIGDVILPRLNGRAIPVYKVAASSRGFHLPYIAYSPSDLDILFQRNCVDPSNTDASFPLVLTVETTAEDVVREGVGKAETVKSVSIYEYQSIRLFDSRNGKTLWQDPSEFSGGNPTTSGYSSTTVRGADINCESLARYIETPGELAANVTIISSIQNTNTARLSYGWFREFALSLDLDKIEEQSGSLSITGRDEVKGRSRSSGLAGALFGGSGRASVVTDTVSSETDGRTRYVSTDALRSVSQLAGFQITAEGYCALNDVGQRDCDSSAMIDRLFEKLTSELPSREFAVLFDEPEDGAYQNYILLERPGSVDRLRNHSFNPSFTNSTTGALDCEKIGQAIAASAGVPPVSAASSAPNPAVQTAAPVGAPPSQSAPGNNPWASSPGGTTPRQPNATSSPPSRNNASQGGDCGVGQNMSISDKNEIQWKYNGSEWVPTSMDLHYINEDTFSARSEGAISETVGSGYGVLLTRNIPVIQKSGDVSLQFNSLSERLGILENRTPRITPIFRRFLTFNSWGKDSLRNDDIRYWWNGGSLSVESVRDRSRNTGRNQNDQYRELVYGVNLGNNFKAVKIPLPNGYNRTNALCTFSGLAGAWNGAGEVAILHVHQNDYYFSGLHRADRAGTVLIECYAVEWG